MSQHWANADDDCLSVEALAAYLDGECTALEAQLIEQVGNRSAAQTEEINSARAFQQQGVPLPMSEHLTQRLLTLGSQRPPEMIQITRARASRKPRVSHVPMFAAALTAAAVVLGVLCWRIATLPQQKPLVPEHRQSIADRPPPRPRTIETPPVVERRELPDPISWPAPQIVEQEPPPGFVPAPQPKLPAPVPLFPPDALAVDSSLGLLLIDRGPGTPLRVAHGRQIASSSFKVVSLAESYSTLAVPRLGTLVLSGAADATLTRQPDRSWQLRFGIGRLAIRDVAAGARLNFETAGVPWMAEATADSALIVADEGGAVSVLVLAGAVVIEGMEVAQGQQAQWVDGALGPPLSMADTAQRWLHPPDDQKRTQWRMLYGKLADRLVLAEDAPSAIEELFASKADPRQTALLASWRLSAAEPALHHELTWETLNDRRESVRQSAVQHLLELPARDQRAVNLGRYLRVRVGNATATQILPWLQLTRSGQAPTLAEAQEMADALTHSELAVRQIAVSLLEQHSQRGLEQLRRKPPIYDAAAPLARRTTAQREWVQILAQLYSPRARGLRGAAPAPQVP